MKRALLALLLVGALAGCSNPALRFLTGGGPNVAANVQAGQENNQTVGQSKSTDLSIVRPQARDIKQTSNESNRVVTERVETVTVNEVPIWIVLLALIGWLLPTPQEMVREVWNTLTGRNRNAVK